MSKLGKIIKDLEDQLPEPGSLQYVSKNDIGNYHFYNSIQGRLKKLRDLKLQADYIIDKLGDK